MESVVATSELTALKTKLRATWIAGDFGEIAKSYASGAEEFIKKLNLKPGMKVLDVACGTGNLALPAARAGALPVFRSSLRSLRISASSALR